MSLAKKSFVTAVVAPIALTAFGLAAANDVQAEVKIGCREPEAVPALQQQVLKDEGMVPVVSGFIATEANKGKVTEWAQHTVMMNPQTKNGLTWIKLPDGAVCIFTRYTEMQLFNNASFNAGALIKKAGAKDTEIEINRVLIKAAHDSGENPMFRAKAYTPTNAGLNLSTEYYEIITSNPKTASGTLIRAELDGKWREEGLKKIPSPAEAPVKYGAIYSETGKTLITAQSNDNPTVALASIQPR